jgi:multicomponent Na+:H+ antiporter subunit E
VVHSVILGVSLSILWWLLSGHTEPLILGLGIGSIIAVIWIAERMDVIDYESHPVHMAPRGILYFPWLLWEIVKANIDIAKVILQSNMQIHPQVMDIVAGQKSDAGLVTFANSITLTPGTVTIGVEENTFLIHALTNNAAAGLASGDMERQVTAMEGMNAKESTDLRPSQGGDN